MLKNKQGTFYTKKMLKAKIIRQGMSCEDTCFDHAMVKIFFHLLKNELLYLQIVELVKCLNQYNNCQSKANLKGLLSAIRR